MTASGVRAARQLRAALVLAVVGVIAAYFIYFHVAQPGTVFRLVNADPEAAYLVNSLAVFEGQPYAMVQHPGTPLLALGTLVIAAVFPFVASSVDGLTTRMAERPELFIVPAHLLLVAANIATAVALGLKAFSVRRRSDAVLAAAVPASFFAFLPDAFSWTFYWSHNAMAFPAGTAILLALITALRRGRPLATRRAAGLGLAAGVLAATQLYFATWTIGIVSALVALPALRRAPLREAARPALAALAGSAAGFAISCLPMIATRRVFVDFVAGIVSHQGLYGGGPAGFTSGGRLRANLALLWGYAPALFLAAAGVIALGTAVFLLDRARRGPHAGRWAAVAGILVQLAATVFLLAKHTSPFYVPAVAAMLPPLLAIAFDLGRRRGPAWRTLCLAVAGLVFAGFVTTAARGLSAHARRTAFRTEMTREVEAFVARSASARGVGRESVLVLWGPGLPDAGCYALWMGIQYANGALAHGVSRACAAEGLAWSSGIALPDGWAEREGAPAAIVTTESAPRLYPAFAAFGVPQIGVARGPSGDRLAFYAVTIDRGRLRPPVH